MIGKDKDYVFIKTELTPEESKKRLDKKIDKLFKEAAREERINKVKNKVLTLIKKDDPYKPW